MLEIEKELTPEIENKINNLNKLIDHTLLKPDATSGEISKLCKEAMENNFASVCVNSCNVELARALLKGSDVKICAVVGFPLGAMTGRAKAFEAREAFLNGANEIDMVINIAAVKEKKRELVIEDIRTVIDEAKFNETVKVIIETCKLTDEEKKFACECAVEAGATFVKTSTGFGGGGATAHDVKLMKETVGNKCLVKASGGIKTYQDAVEMIQAGADRLGCSAGIEIMKGTK